MRVALGVIVAGGRGVRLGGETPKALAMLRGRTLLERAIETLGGCCEDWCVATAADVVLPVAPERLVLDLPGRAGPLAGVAAAFATRAPGEALVLGVDFPLVSPVLLRALAAGLDSAAAVLPAPGGMPQPLVAAYGPIAREALVAAAAAGEDSVLRAALTTGPRLLDDAALTQFPRGLASLLNVNTVAELTEAEQHLLAEAEQNLLADAEQNLLADAEQGLAADSEEKSMAERKSMSRAGKPQTPRTGS